MSGPFDPVRLVDAVIAFTVVEGLVLVAWHRVTGRGVSPRDFVLNMASGLCLMLALRSLADGAGPAALAACLAAAGAAHGTDIWLRWRRGAPSGLGTHPAQEGLR
ncbi:MAG: hypothetical protein ABIV63_09775 [Caldimonas sp.]